MCFVLIKTKQDNYIIIDMTNKAIIEMPCFNIDYHVKWDLAALIALQGIMIVTIPQTEDGLFTLPFNE